MKDTYSKWILTTLLTALILPCIIAGINYFMDPLWCFSISHRFNQKQDDFNERQQKTNRVTFRPFDYQGIIIGTSTATTLSQKSFRGARIYNYAINALDLADYRHYVAYARKRNDRDFTYLIVGIDFISSAKRSSYHTMDPENIFRETNYPLYRLKTLISIDTMMLSRRNFMNYLYGRRIHYDRENIKYTGTISPEFQEQNMKHLLAHFEKSEQEYSFKKFTYNEGYRRLLEELRDDNAGSDIRPFTTPVVLEFMRLMVKNGLLDEYLRWIRDIVNVYGVCYHFMYPNAVTENYRDYFNDPNHYYPVVSDMMVDFMFNGKPPALGNFGMRIDRNNLEERLALLERLMKRAAGER